MVAYTDRTFEQDGLKLSDTCHISLQRTLRVPDDDRTYPLPPGLGRVPLRAVPGVAPPLAVAPLRRREAVWLAFDVPAWRPHAVLIGLGTIDAVAGLPWTGAIAATPQNYVVCPPQLWLDGVKVAADRVRQFVATPLGTGTTIESQLAGTDEGLVRIVAFPPRPGHFPEAAPDEPAPPGRLRAAAGMGLGAGGRIRQRIYPDPYGVDIWDTARAAEVHVRLVSAETYRSLTGEDAPPSPIDASTYSAHGLPWFELYDEPEGDLAPGAMGDVRSLDQIEGTSSPAEGTRPARIIPISAPRPSRD